MRVKLEFGREFKGRLENSRGDSIKIGRESGEFKPYQLLPGALGACFYATFLGIADKQKLDYEGVEIEVSGSHREEVPTVLSEVLLVFKIKGADHEQEKKFIRAAELAEKYCSVYQTIKAVAEMELKIEFV